MAAGALITTDAREFAAALPDGGALLALDLGTQTIGTALCDPGWRFATAGKTLARGKFGRDREVLAALVRERSVKGVVICIVSRKALMCCKALACSGGSSSRQRRSISARRAWRAASTS